MICVSDIARILHMPLSTVAVAVRELEEAGLITTEVRSGKHGATKQCWLSVNNVKIELRDTQSMKESKSLALKIAASYSLVLHQCLGKVWRHRHQPLFIPLAMHQNVILMDLISAQRNDFIKPHSCIKEQRQHGSVACVQVIASVIVIQEAADF